jgi:hypothetical protein
MRALWESIKGIGRFIWKHADAFLVIAIAFGVVIAEVVGNPSSEVVDSAILGLLGVTAVILLRDRVGRDDLNDLRLLARDAISDRPYEVVWQRSEWDLRDRENATMCRTQQIRFTRDDVSSIDHWSAGPGEVVRYEAKWKRPGGRQWIPAHKIHSFPARMGEKVIYSFDEEHSRDDMLDWCIERDAVGRFPDSHEGVSIEGSTQSEHPRVMKIIWPQGVNPSNIELRLEGQPSRPILTKRKAGRVCVEERIQGLGVGETAEIAWVW